MTQAFIDRIKFWQTERKGENIEALATFEKSHEIILDNDYKEILIKHGKLSNSNNWYFYSENHGLYDILLDGTFSLDQLISFKRTHWDHVVKTNPSIPEQSYLPVISTYTASCIFLIGISKMNSGKIYFYDDNFEKYKPTLVADSLSDFFTTKTHCYFPIDKKSAIGTIEIRRPKGTELWDITSAYLSITPSTTLNSLNFWVESDHKIIKALDDTGETPVMYEIKFPINKNEQFLNPWKLTFPKVDQHTNNWGEGSEFIYYDNFYYYDHESFDHQTFEIIRGMDNLFYVKIIGEKGDPIDPQLGRAKFIITVKIQMHKEFKGLWCAG